ncbi:MAG: amidohydrolase family protein, partial [Sphaerochaetaceae bacterium]
MIIDCHVHMLTAKDYADHLVDTMDEAGIDMCCLLAMRQQDMWGSQSGYNNYVMDAYHKYPNRFIPFASVDLGVDPINMIDNLQLEGFRGIKITRTKYNYNDDIMMPYYERAARYDMVFLFHTG